MKRADSIEAHEEWHLAEEVSYELSRPTPDSRSISTRKCTGCLQLRRTTSYTGYPCKNCVVCSNWMSTTGGAKHRCSPGLVSLPRILVEADGENIILPWEEPFYEWNERDLHLDLADSDLSKYEPGPGPGPD